MTDRTHTADPTRAVGVGASCVCHMSRFFWAPTRRELEPLTQRLQCSHAHFLVLRAHDPGPSRLNGGPGGSGVQGSRDCVIIFMVSGGGDGSMLILRHLILEGCRSMSRLPNSSKSPSAGSSRPLIKSCSHSLIPD